MCVYLTKPATNVLPQRQSLVVREAQLSECVQLSPHTTLLHCPPGTTRQTRQPTTQSVTLQYLPMQRDRLSLPEQEELTSR